MNYKKKTLHRKLPTMGLSVLKGFLYCLYYETVPTDVNSAYKNGSREHEHEKRNEKLNLRSK